MKSFAVVVAGLVMAGALASRADALYARQDHVLVLETPINRILGGAKEALGSALFMKADSYFHGGEEAPENETAEEMAREGMIGDSHAVKKSPDWIASINARVKSHDHRHLTESEQKEMLPFFAMALTLDSRNPEAVLTVSYWLDKHLKKPEEAMIVLEKGVRDNPGEWEIEYRLGIMLFEVKKDYPAATGRLRSAAEKSRGRELPRHQKVDLEYFLAEALRLEGRGAEATDAYRRALAFYAPQEQSFLKKDIESKLSLLNGSSGG